MDAWTMLGTLVVVLLITAFFLIAAIVAVFPILHRESPKGSVEVTRSGFRLKWSRYRRSD